MSSEVAWTADWACAYSVDIVTRNTPSLPSAASGTANRTSRSTRRTLESNVGADSPRHAHHAQARSAAVRNTDTQTNPPISMRIRCTAKDTQAISIRVENCSTRSLRGSSTCAGLTVTPSPNGWIATVVSWATEINALAVRASAKVISARLNPDSTYSCERRSSGPNHASARISTA